MTVDVHGGVHSTATGQFTGHRQIEADTSVALDDEQWRTYADPTILAQLAESRAQKRRPYVRARIPLACLITSEDCMAGVLEEGLPSETPDEPILVCCRGGIEGRFELSDGHHRVAALLARGETWVDADIDPGTDDEPYETPFYRFPKPEADPQEARP